jgi:hypothetical protein
MRTTIVSLVLLASAITPGVAAAGSGSDQAAAVQLCRSQVAEQAGVDIDNVRLTGVRESLRRLRVSVSLWRDGAQQTVRCEIDRGEQPTLVSIDPPVQTASAH